MKSSEVVCLTTTAAGVDDNAPEYSPDGRRIVFSSTRLGGAADLDDVFSRWIPDGKQVLFQTFPGR